MPEASVRPSSEAELVRVLTHGIESLWAEPQFVLELMSPVGGRADVSVYSNGRVYSIEAKLTAWRRAIGQAVLNRYWSDRCYIALWHANVTSEVCEEAKRHGVGVIAVKPSGAQTVVGASQSRPRRALKRAMANQIQESAAEESQ